MKHQASTGRIGFLLKTYPKLSETFVLEEILGLERLGMKLHIFSLNPPKDEVVHRGFENVAASVTYIPAIGVNVSGVVAQFKFLVRNPWRYAKTLAFALTRAEGGGLRDLLRAGMLGEKLRQAGITHLHSHFVSEPAGVAELTARLTGVPFSLSAHAKDIYLSKPHVLERKLRNAKFTVTCTCYNRTHLQAIAPNANIFRMYHGIDLERFSRDPQVRKSEPPLLLSVGRLKEKKGFATLIQACLALNLAGIAFRCEIVGYGDERENLLKQIDSFGLGSVVTLTGKMTHAQLIERYRQATLFVLPSQIAEDGDRDGIPNVLLEALAMELPVVTTAVSGIPEVIRNGANGILIPPQNALALSGAITTLLADADSRARMGKAGRRVVETMFCNSRNLMVLCSLLAGRAQRGTAVADNDASVTEYSHVG